MRSVETIPGMGGGRVKENDEGVNLTKIYYKSFCECQNVPPVNNNMIIKK
jgi:hypothetical protein